jgi:CheY-like chemotaxis protein
MTVTQGQAVSQHSSNIYISSQVEKGGQVDMKQKILVIDDDESILEVLYIVLAGEGYHVETSVNILPLQKLDGERPDLILLDVLLSGEDGIEICKRLKNQQQTRDIPIILLSAHSSASKTASNSGANAFLDKPFDIDVLVDLVKEHLPGE